jgi:hypothetical protein
MYCTYLTIYFGTKLPRRYIGSTSIEKISFGYNGSIKSKKYKDIFKAEQLENKHLFKTRILKIYETRKEAIMNELYLHKKYDVVKSNRYMNMSLACPNGWFGRSVCGAEHPFFGKTHSDETKKLLSAKQKINCDAGQTPFIKGHKKSCGEDNGFFGKKHSEESKNKMRKPKKYVPKWKCAECDKILDGGNLYNHMLHKHQWTTLDITEYKNSTAPSHAGNHGTLNTIA